MSEDGLPAAEVTIDATQSIDRGLFDGRGDREQLRASRDSMSLLNDMCTWTESSCEPHVQRSLR